MGVWIETFKNHFLKRPIYVTPFVGVWIETKTTHFVVYSSQVTPFVGVWIETAVIQYDGFAMARHTLRGCVD